MALRAIKAGDEQRPQQKGHTFTAWGVTLIVTMALQAPLSTAGTALGSVGIGIIPKLILVLRYCLNFWQHTIHRPVSLVVVISLARTTITKDDWPFFFRFRLGIYKGMFLDRSWRTLGYFSGVGLHEGRT